MIANGHYDDAAIVALLESPEAAGRDAHLKSCEACAESFASYRQMLGVLDDPSVWDARPVADIPSIATITTLRSFADVATAEDTAAESFLTELLATPREWWRTKLTQHPEHHTAGLVRRLIAAASAAIDTHPPNAVEMTALATEVAEGMAPSRYPSDTVLKLRGAAWRERAYALFYTGDLPAAAAAVSTSESHFCDCSVAEYELARVGIVRALVARCLEQFDEALAAATGSAHVFQMSGDASRLASARLAEAGLQMHTRNYQAAVATLLPLDRQESLSVDTRARVLGNLALCYRELSRPDDAARYYQMAAWLMDELQNVPEAARLRWSVASLSAAMGRFDEAIGGFRDVITEFERLEMKLSAAVANIDLAEVLLTRGEYDGIEATCRRALSYFEGNDLLASERARTALAYVHEAAQQRRISAAKLRHVRQYVEKLPEQPHLLFLPLPE